MIKMKMTSMKIPHYSLELVKQQLTEQILTSIKFLRKISSELLFKKKKQLIGGKKRNDKKVRLMLSVSSVTTSRSKSHFRSQISKRL